MLTVFVIEVATKETASIVGKDSIDANDITTVWILAFEVPVNIIISQRPKFAVGTFRAFEFLFVAKFPIPFPVAYRLIAALASRTAEPSPLKHILTPLK